MIVRRAFFACLALFFLACEQRYERPYGELDLGEVGNLLYTEQFIRDKAILLFRDDGGWSALSTRCTHEGCELSVQEENLLCMCCGSTYTHQGLIEKGPATRRLPWYKLKLSENHLYVNVGDEVAASERFMTPEIQKAFEQLGKRLNEGLRAGSPIPGILLGQGDGEQRGPIFQQQKNDDTVLDLPPSIVSTTIPPVEDDEEEEYEVEDANKEDEILTTEPANGVEDKMEPVDEGAEEEVEEELVEEEAPIGPPTDQAR